MKSYMALWLAKRGDLLKVQWFFAVEVLTGDLRMLTASTHEKSCEGLAIRN